MSDIFRISVNLNTATKEEIDEAIDLLKKNRREKQIKGHKNADNWTAFEDKVGVDLDPSKTSSTRNPPIGWSELPNLSVFKEPIKHPYYDNKNGSLYKIAEQLGLNAYEFDILKRIARCRKKGQFEQDLQKIKDTVDLYLKEHKQ